MLGRIVDIFIIKKNYIIRWYIKLKNAEDVHVIDYDMYCVMRLLSIIALTYLDTLN